MISNGADEEKAHGGLYVVRYDWRDNGIGGVRIQTSHARFNFTSCMRWGGGRESMISIQTNYVCSFGKPVFYAHFTYSWHVQKEGVIVLEEPPQTLTTSRIQICWPYSNLILNCDRQNKWRSLNSDEQFSSFTTVFLHIRSKYVKFILRQSLHCHVIIFIYILSCSVYALPKMWR